MSDPYYEIKLDGETLSASDYPNDILNPIVQKEVNTAGSLTFTMLPTASMIENIRRWKSYLDVEIYGQNVFHGRVKDLSSDFYNQLSVTCEGSLAFLNDAYVRYYDYDIYRWAYNDLQRIMSSDEWITYAEQVDARARFLETGPGGKGDVELDYVEANLIPDGAQANGYISSTDGSFIADSNSSACTEYIQLESGKTYTLIMTDWYYGANQPLNGYIAEYTGTPEHPVFSRIVNHTLHTTYTSNGRLVRPFTRINGNLWFAEITGVENDTSRDNTVVKASDYISEKYMDRSGMMFRTKMIEGRNYFHMLHPKRIVRPKRFTFAENIIDLSKNSPSMEEAYSYLLATFQDKIGGSPTVVYPIMYEIPGAADLFGKIVRTVNFGQASAPTDPGSSGYQNIMNSLKRYADLYNPIIPNEVTIHGIDPAFFDPDNHELIDVCDSITVTSAPNNVSFTKLCLSMKLDLEKPQNNEYKVGDYIKDGDDNRLKSLTESFAKTKKKAKK